ncbi:MAG: hypothetical protein QOH58_2669 [Thermoleophilaceae bacterium]|jgi:hypothetical protein|nr:hypothetical protein [Thermoleophilaceae bacterium]
MAPLEVSAGQEARMPRKTATFELRVLPSGRAIARMLTCCLARGLEIVEVTWRGDGPEAYASLGLAGDPAVLEHAGLWLERLVDVLEVRRA